MIRKTPLEQFAKVVDELRGEMAQDQPAVLNVEQATTMHDPGYIVLHLRWRKRVFTVPPVPYRAALRLFALDAMLRRLREELRRDDTNLTVVAAMEPVVEEMVAIFHALVRPATWLDRLTWRWRANPFRSAEAHEINVLRDFFCAARTRCRVQWASSSRAPLWMRSTWPPNSRHMFTGSLRGVLLGSRAAGDTTGWA